MRDKNNRYLSVSQNVEHFFLADPARHVAWPIIRHSRHPFLGSLLCLDTLVPSIVHSGAVDFLRMFLNLSCSLVARYNCNQGNKDGVYHNMLGVAAEKKLWRMPFADRNDLNSSPVRQAALSETTTSGSPCVANDMRKWSIVT